jgi:hypothetical protein
MEFLGILLSFPVTAAASIVYTLLAVRFLPKLWQFRTLLLTISWSALAMLLFEILAVVKFGILGSRALFGYSFVVLHTFTFFIAPPSVVNVLLIHTNFRFRSAWFVLAMLCFVLAMFCVFWNIEVRETLYGE